SSGAACAKSWRVSIGFGWFCAIPAEVKHNASTMVIVTGRMGIVTGTLVIVTGTVVIVTGWITTGLVFIIPFPTPKSQIHPKKSMFNRNRRVDLLQRRCAKTLENRRRERWPSRGTFVPALP